MSARQPNTKHNGKKNLRLKRMTALLIAAGCIVGPALAQTVIIGNTTTITVNAPPTILGPVDTLILGNQATGNGTLNFSGGTLDVNHVGGYTGTVTVGNSGVGALNQSNASGNSVINITGPQYVNPLPGNFPDPWGGTLLIGRRDNSSGTYTMTSSNANTLELNIERDLHLGGSFFSTELGGGSGSTCTINCSGHFVQDGGAVTVSGAIYVGIASAAASTYTLNSGTLFAQNGLVVGYGSSGNNLFTQNGGTVTAGGSMFVGANGGANGTYVLNNGTLNSGAETWLGAFGTGTITQIGGDHNARQLLIGRFSGGDGTYNLIGGTFTVGNGLTDQLVVGHDGVGTVNMNGGTLTVLNGDVGTNAFVVGNNIGSIGVFNQSGGLVDAGRSLTIAQNGGTGTYNLLTGTDPVLNASIVTVGFSGTGTFNQEFGTTVNTANVFIGSDNGTYNLSGGDLNVTGGQGTIVGTVNVGNFNQTGGAHLTNNLIVGNDSTAVGTYDMSGGTLTVDKGSIVVGQQGAGTMIQSNLNGDSIVTITRDNTSPTTQDLTGNLIIAKSDGSTGTYTMNSVNGNVLQLNVEGRIQIGGSNIDGISCIGGPCTGAFIQNGGTVTASSGVGLGFFGGTGSYTINSGTLNTAFLDLGNTSMGNSFTQNGGTVNADSLVITNASNLHLFAGTNTYTLNDGVLNTTTFEARIGLGGRGDFVQTGGTHNANLIKLGEAYDASNFGDGRYTMSGGALNASSIWVGADGVGTFTLQNGTVTVTGDLSLGKQQALFNVASNGTVNMSGGVLNTGSTIVGENTIGIFNQSGGTHNVSGTLSLGSGGVFAIEVSPGVFNYYSSGTYNLSGDAVLNTGRTEVAGFGMGLFVQSGTSEHNVTGDLVVGPHPRLQVFGAPVGVLRNGEYQFQSGVLTVGGNAIIGGGNNVFNGEPGGLGTFNQTGGVATVSGDVIVGAFGTINGGSGNYSLSGTGALNVGGALIVAQGGGIGVFTQSAGTVTVAGFLTIGEDVGANGKYKLSGGTLTVSGPGSNTLLGGGFTGNPGSGGVGTFEQTGGTFQTSFLNIGGGGFAQKGTGTYTLSAGNLIVDNNLVMGNNVGGSATFNQTGGSVQVNSGLFGAFIDNGTYTLSGNGTLSVVSNLIMGGVGGVSSNFNQSGTSQVTLGHDLSVAQVAGSTASYSLTSSGATLTTGRAYVGESGTGTFTQTAGTVSITAPGGSGDLIIGSTASGNGTYNMSGGNLIVRSNSYIGDAGTGTMNLTGNAVVTVTGNTFIGNNGTGANTGTLTIANNSSYTSNGAVPGGITLGQNAGSSGSIVISNAGTLSTFNRLTVGAAGKGSVLQSGTSVVTAGGLRVGEGATGGPSTYTMNGGTLNVTNTSGVEGGTRIGLAGTGTFNLNAGTHSTTFMEIGGTNFAQGSGGTGVYNLNGGALVASGAISINPQGGSSGTLNVAGGALTAPVIINNDKVNYSGGSITANVNNTANFNVSGGAARTLTGNLSNNAGGVLTVSAATPFTVSGVLTQAAGASIVAGANITVGQDYNNLGSGSGNTYDRRAGVTGAGQILAAGAGAATAQTLSGNVTGANAAGATMNFGNVRVGQSSTQSYNIGNSNTGGPDLRGAIQTTVNGANLTDARLSGAGVTAGTWGPVAAGGTNGGLGVTFTASSAGALSNQKIAIVNNFENTNSQVLTITGAAFNVAVGSTVTPVTVANQRIGGSNTATLNVTNAAAPGSFSEDLNVSVGGTSGATGIGSITGRVAGTNNTGVGAINVGIGTATAGAQSGTVTLNYQTAGTVNGVSNGLGTASIGSGVVTVNGNVYQIAQPSPGSLPTTVNLGNFRAGAGAQSQAINITNTNAGAPLGFQEGLAANVGATTGGATGTGFTNAVVGTSGALQVGLSGIAAGVNSGTVQVQLQSNGITTTGSNGLAALNLGGPQTVTVTGTGFNAAIGNATPSPLVVANQRIGTNLVAALTVTNQATAGAFSEDLRASFSGSTGGAQIAGGNINALLAGASDNSTMGVRVDASSAGAKSGTVTLGYQTTGTVNGVSNGLGVSAANGPQVINVSGNVYQVANPTPGTLPATVNLGNFRAGAGAQSQNINITNTNIAPINFQEGLAANIVTTTGTATGAGFTNAQAGASGALQVGLSGIAAGVNSGTVQVQLQSNGTTTTGSNGLGSLNLGGAQTVTVTGTGYRLAQANSIGAVNFGNIHVGDVASQALSITNQAAADGFSEKLNASFGATTDARILTNGGTINQLAAGQTNNTGMVISLNTAAAGVVSGTARVNLVSDGTGTSGLGLTNLPGQDVGVSGTITAVGNVYRLANPVIDTAQPVAFGNVRVGASVSQILSITNNVPNDGFSEKLNAQSGATTGGVTATGTFSLLGAGASDTTNVRVGINTATAGLKNGTATINFQSDGTGTSGLGITNLASQNVTVTGAVYNMAVGNATPNGTIALGNFRVGQPGGGTPQSQGIAITNTVVGPFTESLGVASASVNNAAFNLTNAIGGNLVAAGATTNNALNIARTGGSAGVNTGTIAVQYTSDGAGTSGLAAINSNAQNITVNATGYNTAVGSAAPGGTIALGNFRVGQPGGVAPQSQGVAITNTVAGPFTESLGVASASVNNAAFNLTNNIGGNLVAAGATTNNALNIARTGGSAGVNTGTIAIQYTTDGAGTSGLAAINSNAQNITVNATGYNTAVGNAAPGSTITLGSFRVGQPGGAAPQNQGIAITNTVAGPFTESLGVASASVNNAAFNLTNNIGGNLVAAGATTNNALNIARTGGSAGLNTGTIAIQYASDGTGTSGLAAINSNAQNITVNATGYTTAIATVQPAAVNFGIVHVGQAVALQGVSVQNTALVTGSNDTLNASIGGATGPFTTNSGSVAGLAAGAAANTTALKVGLNTTTAGVYSGNATVNLASHNADMADLALVAQAVALTGQVNNYANGALRKNSGAGSFGSAGRVYTLDLGTSFHNTGLRSANLGALNDVLGPSDLLDGSFELLDAIDFGVSGFNPFANLDAGQSVDNLLVNLSTANLGSFEDTYLVHLFGHNSSGFREALGDLTLILRGNVIEFSGNVPEPDSLLLMLIALAGLRAARRRKTA